MVWQALNTETAFLCFLLAKGFLRTVFVWMDGLFLRMKGEKIKIFKNTFARVDEATHCLASLPFPWLDFRIMKDVFLDEPQFLKLHISVWKKHKGLAPSSVH